MKPLLKSDTDNTYNKGMSLREMLKYKNLSLCKNVDNNNNDEFIKEYAILQEQKNHLKVMIKALEKENLELKKSLEPYQLENGKLLIENNELQNQLSKQENECRRKVEEARRKEKEKEKELKNLELVHRCTLETLKDLEKELLEKNKKISDLAGDRIVVVNSDGKGHLVSAELPVLEISQPLKIDREKLEDKLWESRAQASDVKVVNMVDIMEKRSAELLEQLEELKFDNRHQSEIIAALKCQLNQKEREIDRLHHNMEGGRPLSAVSRDSCTQCKLKDNQIKALEEQLESAVMKQHEAMSRALHLAEKNQRLERELKDIDNMALAVEEECQNKVKQNLKNMDILQENLRVKIEEVKKLEETIKSMKNKIERDGRELENLKTENKLLEKNLNLATNEKKNLNDKINHFLLIEKNLNSEISRLQEINKSLQRQIGDMEMRVMDVLGTNYKGRCKTKPKKQHSLTGSRTDSTGSVCHGFRTEPKCCGDFNCSDHCLQKSNVKMLDKLEEERDFYRNECHRLKDLIGSYQGHAHSSVDLIKQLKQRDQEIKDLEQEIMSMRRDVPRRFERGDHLSYSSGDSVKIILDRLEKERDMALSDISRLQGERDALKEKIKLATESQLGEQSRLERIVMENEERIRRLESERRELISNQSSLRVSLVTMEEKCDELKEQARAAQSELAQMTANYNQLKTLQEQTDHTLSDVQGRLGQASMELRFATNRIKELEKEKEDLENEISVLKKEKTSLKSSLTFLEKEKDELLITLDEKTEKVAKLENQIKKQETYVMELTEKMSNLEKRFQFTLDEKTNREHGLRTLERAVEHLKEELEKCERQKDALIKENRRLQDDLASAAKDCLTARRDLDGEKQEVENLKRQLQQYVGEVKRAEELLTKKETERNQMLEHFRSLSLEATALETNNHTLESTVENTKLQLSSANNRIMDLEHEIASKESLLYSYEKEIAELTTRIAELETKLKQQSELRARAEEDLSALRDLCSAIDSQKEALRRQASNHDEEKTQLINEVRRLSEEYEGLNQKLSHERSLSQTLEKSLSNSRQETLEHKITNKDLQTHVQHLRQKVDELTQKLESESQDVRRYQAQCAELSQQVSELRREVTNARFEQAKAMEDSRRNFSQNLDTDFEETKEIWFEGETLGNSERNIPPLTFPEDSDRTFSSEQDPLNLCTEQPGTTFRKFWKLSPLPEKSSDTPCKADTSSELSSLPEDSEVCKISISSEKTTLSPYPTYSIRKGLDSETRTYDVNNAENVFLTGRTFENDSCSECEIQKPDCACVPETASSVPVCESLVIGKYNLAWVGSMCHRCSLTV